jgi:hypothetical protein
MLTNVGKVSIDMKTLIALFLATIALSLCFSYRMAPLPRNRKPIRNPKMSGFQYRVDSLAALAERFDDYAEMAVQNSKQLQVNVLAGSRDTALQCAAIAATWREAADILRHTVLTPPNSSV